MELWKDTSVNRNRYYLKGHESLVTEHYTQELTFVPETFHTKEYFSGLGFPKKRTTYKRVLKRETLNRSEEFPLREVTKEELKELRRSGQPGFVLKEDDKYYYAEIKYNTRLLSRCMLSGHKCELCKRLSAAADCDGGCAKVREGCRGIERYKWITSGYESFNVYEGGVFIVEYCDRYRQIDGSKKKKKALV